MTEIVIVGIKLPVSVQIKTGKLKQILTRWQRHMSSLGYRTPKEFASLESGSNSLSG